MIEIIHNQGSDILEDKKSLASLFSMLIERGIRLWVEDGTLRFSTPKNALTEEIRNEIREHKSQIMDVLCNAGEDRKIIKLKKVDRKGPIYASSEQSRLWFVEQIETGGAYSLPMAIRIKGKLSSKKIEEVVHILTKRHEAFRTSFVLKDSVLMQVIHESSMLEVHHSNTTELDLDNYLRILVAEPLYCNSGPIGRVHIINIVNDDHVFLMVLHHIITDGWSSAVFSQELIEGLTMGTDRLVPKKYDFIDFCALRDASYDDKAKIPADSWWKSHLAGAPSLSTFPWDLPRRAKRSGRLGVHTLKMQQKVSEVFDAFLEQGQLSAFTVLNAIQALTLAVMSAQNDVVVGSPVANRQGTIEIEECVGFFANIIAIRHQFDLSQDVHSYLQQCNKVVRESLVHQAYPFERAVETSGVIRDASFLPLVQTIMAVQELPFDMEKTSELSFSSIALNSKITRFDWETQAWKDNDIWHFHCGYDADLYSSARAEDIIRGILTTLENCITFPASSLEVVAKHCTKIYTQDGVLRKIENAAGNYKQNSRRIAVLRADIATNPVISLFMDKLHMTWELRSELNKELSSLAGIPVEIIPLDHVPLTDSACVDMAYLLTAPMVPVDRISVIEKKMNGSSLFPLPTVLQRAADFDLTTVAPELLLNHSANSFHRAPLVTLPPSGTAHIYGEPLVWEKDAPRTIPEALKKTAKSFPEKGLTLIFHTGEEYFLSYAELYTKGLSVASGFMDYGVGVGSFVLLQLTDMSLYFPALWGCFLCGATPVTVSSPRKASKNDAIFMKLVNAWKLLKRPVILHQLDNKEFLQSGKALFDANEGEINFVEIEHLLTYSPLKEPVTVDNDDIALLQLTSGSTGMAKGVQIRQRGVAVHVASTKQFNGYNNSWKSLNWLPYDHVGALLTYHITDSWIGCSQVVVSTDYILNDMGEWLRLLEKHDINRSWSPNFGFKLVLNYIMNHPDRQWDLSKLRYLMNGGEQVTPSVLREFENFLLRNNAHAKVMQPAFGMAESCSTVSYENEFHTSTSIHSYDRGMLEKGIPDGDIVELSSLGRVVIGNELKIVDEHGSTLPERRIGRFLIHGEVVTHGYYNNSAATVETLIGDGWLDSGDLAFIDSGRLFMTGRAKETIVLNGVNYYCHEMEDSLNDIKGIRPTWIAAVGGCIADAESESLGLFFVPDSVDMLDEDIFQIITQIKLKIIDYFGVASKWCLPLTEQDFPKGTSGKIQRNHLRLRLEQGDFDELINRYGQNTQVTSAPAWLCTSVLIADGGTCTTADIEFKSFILPVNDAHKSFEIVLQALKGNFPLCFVVEDNHKQSQHIYGAVIALVESTRLLEPKRDIRCLLVDGDVEKVLACEIKLRASSKDVGIIYIKGKRFLKRLQPVTEKAIEQGKPIDLSLPIFILGGLGGIGSALAEDVLKRGSAKVFIATRSLQGKNKTIYDRLASLGGDRLELIFLDKQGVLESLDRELWGKGGLVINAAGAGADTELLSVPSILHAIDSKESLVWQLEHAVANFPAVSIVHISSITGMLGGIGVEAYAAAHGWFEAEVHTTGRRIIAFSQWYNTGVSKGLNALDSEASHGMKSLTLLQGVHLFWLALRSPYTYIIAGLDLSASGIVQRSTIMPVLAEQWAISGDSLEHKSPIIDIAGRVLPVTYVDVQLEEGIGNSRDALIQLALGKVLHSSHSLTVSSDNEIENIIASIWSIVLEHNSFTVMDNFFSVGGSSLLLVRVHKRIEEHLGKTIPLVTLYHYPTIKSLAEYLDDYGRQEGKKLDVSSSSISSSSDVIARASQRAAQRRNLRVRN